jgi:hypothetical protein
VLPGDERGSLEGWVHYRMLIFQENIFAEHVDICKRLQDDPSNFSNDELIKTPVLYSSKNGILGVIISYI